MTLIVYNCFVNSLKVILLNNLYIKRIANKLKFAYLEIGSFV